MALDFNPFNNVRDQTPFRRRQTNINTQKQNQVSRQDIANATDPNKKAYLEARRAGNWDEAARLQRKGKQTAQFNQELNVFDTAQGEQSDQLLDLFRQESELRKARATNSFQTNMSSQLSASGIRGPAEHAARGRMESEMLSRMGQEQTDFTSKLAQIQSAQRQGFLQNQFNFFHELDRMAVSHDYQKDLINLQAEIQSDQNKWNWVSQIAGIAGSAALTFFTGGAAAPLLAQQIGSAVSNQAGGGAQASDPSTYNWNIT